MANDALPSGPSRYIVGIDLGTTNSAMAFVDTEQAELGAASQVQDFPVPQIVAPGVIEARDTLPSFHYEPAGGEFAAGAMRLPWQDRDPPYVVGTFARDHGETVPGRLISSAKSWLCHAGVDRTAELLPWHGAEDVVKLSPVDVGARYLEHFRRAWNYRFPRYPLEEQEIVLTLPASFDEVARELTIRSAKLAGLNRVVLLEEPQAAFYAWITAHADRWQTEVEPGQKILVCDIGGGTTDFTLIRVRAGGDGRVQFHRVAVGDHLILGGDNLDLALAHHLERKATDGGKLEPRAWATLLRSCRQVKETLLGPAPPERIKVNLPGGGSRLIGGGRSIELDAGEGQALLVEGFLPRTKLDEKPPARRSGFQEFGLPYAPDAAMTRYLGAFLSAHRHVATDDVPMNTPHDPARPDIVLFNGGFFESPQLRSRLLEVLGSWFAPPGATGAQAWQPRILDNHRLDLAVARGAAYYGLVRRGQGVRIAAGSARTYYVGLGSADEAAAKAVCLLPAGIDEGQGLDLPGRTFELRIREPVEFPLYYSSTRLTDPVGSIVAVDPLQMSALPPIRTVLQTAKKGTGETITVELHAKLTEIGTLELWCTRAAADAAGAVWKLQFDVRSAVQTDREAHAGSAEASGFVEADLSRRGREPIRATYENKDEAHKPESLIKRLEESIGSRRSEWPVSLLREQWQELFELEQGRRLSEEHEARWLWTAGFALRPGYGLAVDDWRVAQTWKLLQAKRFFHGARVRVEWLILWRRIAGGLTAGQQRALAEPLAAPLRVYLLALKGSKAAPPRKPDFGFSGHESAEVWRLLGSLELLEVVRKEEIAHAALILAPKEKTPAVQDALIWTIGRIGARVPMYGPLNVVVPAEVAAGWSRTLMGMKGSELSIGFALMQLARKTGDRFRDVDEQTRRSIVAWFDRVGAADHLRELVVAGGRLAGEEQGRMFGESLPRGLRLSE
ncbi:MAG: hsp70 family protein [Planctomycetia bacterium]|nr:hsp70 family protein [Planctomycetia bacterium]